MFLANLIWKPQFKTFWNPASNRVNTIVSQFTRFCVDKNCVCKKWQIQGIFILYAPPPRLKMKCDIWQTLSRPSWIANIPACWDELLIWNGSQMQCHSADDIHFVEVILLIFHSTKSAFLRGLEIRIHILQNHKNLATFEDLELIWGWYILTKLNISVKQYDPYSIIAGHRPCPVVCFWNNYLNELLWTIF